MSYLPRIVAIPPPGKRRSQKYIVDVSGGLPTILLEIDPADSLIKKSYFYANGEVLMQYNGNHKADKYFYLHDRLGSVRQIINSSGNVVYYYTYGPFGQTIEESSTEPPATSNSFLFTGQWFDPEIGQYYLRARQYDPLLMRFSSRDPITGQFEEPMTLHKYLYCGNDPVNKLDIVGLWTSGLRNHHVASWWEKEEPMWHGHSDMGYHIDDFHYEIFDEAVNPVLCYPWGTRYHFQSLGMSEMYVYTALLAGDQEQFGWAGHMGQDYFSHAGKGYSTIGTVGHAFAPGGDVPRNPDNPYAVDDKGEYVHNAQGDRQLSSEYLQADEWTKRMEDLWYLFDDPLKWIGAND